MLEICALTDTLILDEDGVYDPGHFNDRLLLGLKGTMSEAELHVLHARLQGGVLSKASRGELRSPLPTGFVYAPDGRVVLDPDQQIRDAIQLFFQTFRRTGSAWTTVQLFRQQGWLFPRRVRAGQRKGEVVWGPLLHNTARQVLHNPRYAGAFAYGRTHTRKTADGHQHVDSLPRDEWHALLFDAHAGYVRWEEYEDNLRQLLENAQLRGADRRKSPPREGPALLQGLAICGRCGGRMTVRYHTRRSRLIPDYMCQRDGIEHGRPICQAVSGVDLEKVIGELLVEAVTPLALEVALTVQQELDARADEADRLRRQQLDRARYEADLAQRRYLQVDPDNRLVADALEADWNEKLRTLAAAQDEYEHRRQADGNLLSEQQRQEILALATDFPRLWHDPATPDRERKRMVRLLLEDVTLLKGDEITARVRFKGGATRALTLPLPRGHETNPAVLRQIDTLLEQHTDAQIAFILNQRGVESSGGQPFNRHHIRDLRQSRDLQDRFTRLRTAGFLTLDEIAANLDVCTDTVKKWRRGGLLRAQPYNDKNQYLYEPLGKSPPPKWKHKLHRRQPASVQAYEV